MQCAILKYSNSKIASNGVISHDICQQISQD
jgi:hypothetical protein